MRPLDNAIAALSMGLIAGAAIPAVSLWLGSWFIAEPSVIGPFLLMSPLLAVVLLFAVIMARSERERNQAITHPTLEKEINEIGESLGLPRFAVYAQPRDQEKRRWPILVMTNDIYVYLESWEAWKGHTRDFMVAFLLWRSKDLDRLLPRLLPTLILLSTLGCLASIANPWLIIPLHSFSLLGGYFWLRSHELKSVQEADAMALSSCRDYGQARGFVQWHNNFYRIFGNEFAIRRNMALREAAMLRGHYVD